MKTCVCHAKIGRKNDVCPKCGYELPSRELLITKVEEMKREIDLLLPKIIDGEDIFLTVMRDCREVLFLAKDLYAIADGICEVEMESRR